MRQYGGLTLGADCFVNGPLSLLKQRTVARHVAVGHLVLREAGLDGCAAAGAINLTDPSDGFDGLVQGVDQEAGHPVLDEFGHRAPFEGDDRGAASHRLDDGEAERLVEVDQMQQRAGLAKRPGSRRSTDRPEIRYPLAVDGRGDPPVEIVLVLDDAGHDQPPVRTARRLQRPASIAPAAPLSEWIRPKNSKLSPPAGSNGKSSSGMPW